MNYVLLFLLGCLSVTTATGRWMLLDHAGSRRRKAREEERRIVTPTCVDVPNNMLICRNMEYSLMKMPNILGHDTIKEARTEADIWLPLVDSKCDADTSLFLCSIFAPVCVPEMTEMVLPPCRELCEEVQKSCSPTLATFGFVWPEMFECSKFPPASSYMCVDRRSPRRVTTTAGPPRIVREPHPSAQNEETLNNNSTDDYDECDVCDQSVEEYMESNKAKIDLVCSSGIVIKIKVKRVVYKANDIHLMAKGKKVRIFKANNEQKSVFNANNKMVITLKNAVSCNCDIEEGRRRTYFLVTGFLLNDEVYATYVHPWTQNAKRYARELKRRCRDNN
uniref:Secreted frizzled related protein 1 n=1 Tax=Nemertoderma westbladi TaxID=172109 RepID=A0A2P1DVE8_9BILA|nr:secreted frizzled related protein 1 [Nemertoderma westbladi]